MPVGRYALPLKQKNGQGGSVDDFYALVKNLTIWRSRTIFEQCLWAAGFAFDCKDASEQACDFCARCGAGAMLILCLEVSPLAGEGLINRLRFVTD